MSSPSNDNVEYLPIWKKDATPEERFLELAMIARKHPERFKRMVVLYQEELPNPGGTFPKTMTRYVTNGVNTTEALGVIELGKLELLRYTHTF